MGRLPRALVRLAAAAARARPASSMACDCRRHRRPLTEEQVKGIVVKVLDKRGNHGTSPNSREFVRNLFRVSSSLVMFGAIWQYVDKSNELTKEHIMTHLLMGQLEVEKKVREREREEYALKAKQDQKKWFWF